MLVKFRDSWTRRYLCLTPIVFQRCGKPQNSHEMLSNSSFDKDFCSFSIEQKHQSHQAWNELAIWNNVCLSRPCDWACLSDMLAPKFWLHSKSKVTTKINKKADFFFHFNKMGTQKNLNSSKLPSIPKTLGPPPRS